MGHGDVAMAMAMACPGSHVLADCLPCWHTSCCLFAQMLCANACFYCLLPAAFIVALLQSQNPRIPRKARNTHQPPENARDAEHLFYVCLASRKTLLNSGVWKTLALSVRRKMRMLPELQQFQHQRRRVRSVLWRPENPWKLSGYSSHAAHTHTPAEKRRNGENPSEKQPTQQNLRTINGNAKPTSRENARKLKTVKSPSEKRPLCVFPTAFPIAFLASANIDCWLPCISPRRLVYKRRAVETVWKSDSNDNEQQALLVVIKFFNHQYWSHHGAAKVGDFKAWPRQLTRKKTKTCQDIYRSWLYPTACVCVFAPVSLLFSFPFYFLCWLFENGYCLAWHKHSIININDWNWWVLGIPGPEAHNRIFYSAGKWNNDLFTYRSASCCVTGQHWGLHQGSYSRTPLRKTQATKHHKVCGEWN